MAYTAYGIDYTGGLPAATLAQATIEGHPLRFVIRYLSDYPSKNLTPAEAKALSAVGVEIVVVWEDGATDAEQGYAAGVRNATRALQLARACGMPAARPVYLCVDENTTVGPHVRSYFQGAGTVLGRGARAAYGDFAIIKDLFDEDLIDFGMQTYAWSNQKWDQRAQLQQFLNDRTLAGASVDYNRATAADYGQWRVGVTPTPSPKPQEDDMANTVSAGGGAQTIDPGKDAIIALSSVYSDKHKLVKNNLIIPDAAYEATGVLDLELTGLAAGDSVDVAWSWMHTDGKGGWKLLRDARRRKVFADPDGVLRANYAALIGVGPTTPLCVKVYNTSAKPVAVSSALVEVELIKQA